MAEWRENGKNFLQEVTEETEGGTEVLSLLSLLPPVEIGIPSLMKPAKHGNI